MLKKIKRIWHPWDKWECYKAGFFGTSQGINKKQAEAKYKEFLETPGLFEESLQKVLREWTFSCEHNLTCSSLNKIAWGGQAACCYAWGISSEARAGYNLLSPLQRQEADAISEKLIRAWYKEHEYEQPETL